MVRDQPVVDIKRMQVIIGNKKLPAIAIPKDVDKALVAMGVESGMALEKGVTTSLMIGKLTKIFKVKKPFFLHAVTEDRKLLVTIDLSFDTLKGLGFITIKKK